MGRAEEGSAAFCSFYNSCWYWYLLGGEFDFLAALFLYIYVLIILGPNICLLHIYIIHLGAGFACISCFSHLVSEGVERHGEKGEWGGGRGVRRASRWRRAFGLWDSVRVYDEVWAGGG